MSDLPQISEAEFEVMKIVWKHAPISTNEITDKLLPVSYTHLDVYKRQDMQSVNGLVERTRRASVYVGAMAGCVLFLLCAVCFIGYKKMCIRDRFSDLRFGTPPTRFYASDRLFQHLHLNRF